MIYKLDKHLIIESFIKGAAIGGLLGPIGATILSSGVLLPDYEPDDHDYEKDRLNSTEIGGAALGASLGGYIGSKQKANKLGLENKKNDSNNRLAGTITATALGGLAGGIGGSITNIVLDEPEEMEKYTTIGMGAGALGAGVYAKNSINREYEKGRLNKGLE